MTSKRQGHETVIGEIHDAKTAMGLMRGVLSVLSHTEILVISAYLTVYGLRELFADMQPTNRVRILTRWQPGDLASGASDLASFDFAHSRGWTFFTSQSLHAKAFVFGNQAIFIGSANLTRRGFSVGTDQGNIEILAQVPATSQNIDFLRQSFADAVEIDQALFEQTREWLDVHASRIGAEATDDIPIWPLLHAERECQRQGVTNLTISECFLTDGDWIRAMLAGQVALTTEQQHDMSMLAQIELANRGAVVRAIRQTKVFRWLEHQLSEAEGGELYFGTLTAGLHDVLIDDPQPYRRDVKVLLAFLLSWIKAYPECGICVDRPNHSERVRLIYKR